MTDNEIPNNPVILQPSPPSSVTPRPKKRPKREGLTSMASTLAVLLIAPLVALFLTAFVFQSYQVDGPSMQTTLFNNDRLLVWKLPKTWARITGHPFIPNRGDIVIFTDNDISSEAAGLPPGKQLIKRVIGLPGERVVVKDNTVTVYNSQHPNGFRPDKTLPYGNVITNTGIDRDTTVPAGKVFVMGDNRDNSYDSRSFGAVDARDIVGKLVMRVWPLNQAKRF